MIGRSGVAQSLYPHHETLMLQRQLLSVLVSSVCVEAATEFSSVFGDKYQTCDSKNLAASGRRGIAFAHEHYPTNYSDHPAGRSVAYLAIQFRLGLLPK